MKKIITFIIMTVFSLPVSAAEMPVIDMANLVQNMDRALTAIRIESNTMHQIAQSAREIELSTRQVMALKSQIEIAMRNIESIKRVIETGDFKTIAQLNDLCFKVCQLGYTLDSIEYTYKRLYGKGEQFRDWLEQQQAQRDEIDSAAQSTLAAQVNVKDSTEQDYNEAKIMLLESRNAKGTKSAVQAQTEMQAIIIRQNSEIQRLLATQARLLAVVEAQRNSEANQAAEEHERLMSDWGETSGPSRPMTDFP